MLLAVCFAALAWMTRQRAVSMAEAAHSAVRSVQEATGLQILFAAQRNRIATDAGTPPICPFSVRNSTARRITGVYIAVDRFEDLSSPDDATRTRIAQHRGRRLIPKLPGWPKAENSIEPDGYLEFYGLRYDQEYRRFHFDSLHVSETLDGSLIVAITKTPLPEGTFRMTLRVYGQHVLTEPRSFRISTTDQGATIEAED